MTGVQTPPTSASGSTGPAPGAMQAAKTGVLAGPAFERRTRTAPTADGETAGRWVAADESGWNGEALLQLDEPYMVIGSVAVDDATAAELVATLRQDARLQQSGELKFSQFAGRGKLKVRRLEVLAALLGTGGALADRASVFLVDKRYFIVGKIIDLLLEEYVHDHGEDLHAGDQARMAARTLLNDGPRALGLSLFNDLIRQFTNFAKLRNRGQTEITVVDLFQTLDLAERRSRRRTITQLLQQLCRCREQADELQRQMNNARFVSAMEPLTPSIPAILDIWSRKLGPVSMLLDAHKVFTDDHLDQMWEVLSGRGHPDFWFRWQTAQPRGLVRGTSNHHPSIQLADLVAGAGRAVAHFHEGLSTIAAQAGEILHPDVVPLIAAEGLFAHDEPQRFGIRKATTAVT